MIINKNLEFHDLNKEAEELQDPVRAAEIIKRYEDIIKTRKERNDKHVISSRTDFKKI